MRNIGKKIFCFFVVFLSLFVICPCSYSGFQEGSKDGRGNEVSIQNKVKDKIDIMDIKNMDILDVLKMISQKSGLNIIASKAVVGNVTVYLKDINAFEALCMIVDMYGWAYKKEGNVIKVMTAREFEGKYNNKFGYDIEARVKKIASFDPNKILAVLGQIKSSEGKLIADKGSESLIMIDRPFILDRMEDVLEKMDINEETRSFSLSYADAEKIAEKIKGVLTNGSGSVSFDERTNKLVVTDTYSNMEKVSKLVSSYDKKDKEVLIQAKILQVLLNDDFKMGVDWDAIISDYHSLDVTGNLDILGPSDKRGRISIGALSKDDYEVLIEAINIIGKSNILSCPKITVVNKKEARIMVGSTEPYVTTTTTTPSSGPATNAENVNFIEVGVKLFVMPVIHNDGYITMKIKPEVSSVTGNITTGTNNVIPIVETSEAETTVVVKDGVTIVIGGLIKDESISSQKSVPLLGNVPVLGAAFRSRSSLKKKTEIVIFLTPQIINGDVL